MSKSKKIKGHPPSYYVYRRLWRNIPAVIGFGIIVLFVLLSFFGYLISPNKVPYADEQILDISKKPPFFKARILKERINRSVVNRNFLVMMFLGQESIYKPHAIEKYRIDQKDLTIYIQKYEQKRENALSLVDVVFPLYVGNSSKLDSDKNRNVLIEGDKVRFLNLDEQIQTISKKEIIALFEAKHLETRFYLLGTDTPGRDTLSRLLFGIRISLGVGLISMFISILVGVTFGAFAGFFGGRTDSFILWLMTIVWSIPGILLVVAISLALGRGVLIAFVAIGLTSWVEIARVVRGQIISIKEKPFVEAARALGMKNHYIIAWHILPNIFGPLIVVMTSNFASAILTEAGLSFLGLSVQSPVTSWGQMVSEGFKHMTSEGGFYLVLFPSLAIGLMVLSFNLFGNGLRDAYDPRTDY